MDAGTSAEASVARDPVCGMAVEREGARHTARHAGQTYYFCCARCRERFAAAPEEFLAARPRAQPAPEGSLYTCPMDPEVVQAAPGDCPKCGMALEPMVPVAEAGPNPELVDLRRRLRLAAPLAALVFALEMGAHAGIPFDAWLGPRWFVALQFLLATPVLWIARAFFLRGLGLAAEAQPQHVDADRARHRRRLALQPGRACLRPAPSPPRSRAPAGSRRPTSRRRR